MFKELKEYLKSENRDKRRSVKIAYEKRMEELHKPVECSRNVLGSLFTCFLHSGMELTKNLAKQAIREHVIIRKIIGTIRSESGSRNYQYVASLLST
jgi:hypothetical protein